MIRTRDITDKQVVEACKEFHHKVQYNTPTGYGLLLKATGAAPKVILAAMFRAHENGLIDYGTSITVAFPTQKGLDLVKDLMPRIAYKHVIPESDQLWAKELAFPGTNSIMSGILDKAASIENEVLMAVFQQCTKGESGIPDTKRMTLELTEDHLNYYWIRFDNIVIGKLVRNMNMEGFKMEIKFIPL